MKPKRKYTKKAEARPAWAKPTAADRPNSKYADWMASYSCGGKTAAMMGSW